MASESRAMSDSRTLALRVARSVATCDGRALFVGGFVRDRLLQKESSDIDIEVYGLTAQQLQAILARIGPVNMVGASFSVFKLGSLDISLPRTESRIGSGHRDFSVIGDPMLPTETAARRRDFTVNAIAWDPLRDEYLDPFDGRSDLAQRQLKMVDPSTFGDDSLRVLRGIQLAARLNFDLDQQTKILCRTIPLDTLPAERIWGEIEKLLLLAERPSIGFSVARDLGVIDQLFPELAALIDCPQEPEWHPEGDVWKHTLLVIDQVRNRIENLPKPQQLALMLGAICHDFGKPSTTELIDGRIRSLNHEAMGIAPTEAFLDRLNVHTLDGYNIRRQVIGLVAHHLTPGMWHKTRNRIKDGAFYRLAAKVDLELLAYLAAADCQGRTGDFDCSAMDWFLERSRAVLQAIVAGAKAPRAIIMGRHLLELGLQPGPLVGEILRELYEYQLDGKIRNLNEGIGTAKTIIATKKPNLQKSSCNPE